MRGQKEVEKLLKVKRIRKTKATTASQAVESSDGEDEDEDEVMEGFVPGLQGVVGDDWHAIDDSGDSDAESISSTVSRSKTTHHAGKAGSLGVVVEDSD